jgi:hypothetical protein
VRRETDTFGPARARARHRHAGEARGQAGDGCPVTAAHGLAELTQHFAETIGLGGRSGGRGIRFSRGRRVDGLLGFVVDGELYKLNVAPPRFVPFGRAIRLG